jgi:RyR domain-containing protein
MVKGRSKEQNLMELPDIEKVAEKVHDEWMKSKLKQGVTSRKSETDEELMVPYDELSEAAKELDRGTVRAVYAAIEDLSKQLT